MQGRRVAVTGIGVVARAGMGAEAFWEGLLAEAPVGYRQIEDWDPSPYFDNPKESRRSDPCSQYALAAAAQAIEMAGNSPPIRRGEAPRSARASAGSALSKSRSKYASSAANAAFPRSWSR